MKKILLLTGVLLALTYSLASAAVGLDMAWSGCPVTLSNPTDITDPCTDDGGLYLFAMSFNPPAGITKLSAETFLVDVQTSEAVLPDWWHVEDANATLGTPAGCRFGSFGFATTNTGMTTATCKNYWGTSPQAGTTIWFPGVNGPNRTRLYGAFARGSASAAAVNAGTEYFAGTGFFDTNHATPANGICQGCQFGACIVWNYLLLQQPVGTPGGDFTVESVNVRRHLTWQGAVGVSPGVGCPAATPVRNATWGQVKSLYR